jgi:hypothetical protein
MNVKLKDLNRIVEDHLRLRDGSINVRIRSEQTVALLEFLEHADGEQSIESSPGTLRASE